MKLASYAVDGRATWGAVIGDGLLDFAPRYGATLRNAAAAGTLPAIAKKVEGAIVWKEANERDVRRG